MGKFKLLVAGLAVVAIGSMGLGAAPAAGAEAGGGTGTNLWCC